MRREKPAMEHLCRAVGDGIRWEMAGEVQCRYVCGRGPGFTKLQV